MLRILIAEDEEPIANLIRINLTRAGYQCTWAPDGQTAADLMEREKFDLALLDIMLPGIDGYELCRRLRAHTSSPVLFLSARDTELDKVVGLEIGGDDYLSKPFHLAELSMRIYALIRRKEFAANNTLWSNGIEINLPGKSVRVDGRPVVLTRMEYELLLFFVSNAGSKASIAEHLSGDMADMLDNYDFVYTHIKNLKAKLADAGVADCIRNVYGTGYKWNEE